MQATSAFGKSEKGYLISITVEIVAGLSFSRGNLMHAEIDKYRIMQYIFLNGTLVQYKYTQIIKLYSIFIACFFVVVLSVSKK